ncbi:MAG TPA: sensor histidine kinase KdpD [Bordetella sp.]
MTDPGNPRPDPDQLLKHLDNAAADARRGRLRIYFGASAGVGKTYAMLAAARAQRDQGVDVVAGVIETHGRRETAALLDGLPQLPPQAIAYRDRTLEEFDLPGALARRPQLLLVDELAHTNVPGARHAKRWQDVDELIGAGIDVWTTLNVQHLDSLNEAVGGITGIKIWETVPDAVFDAADEIILVDLSADELLRRLQEGRVYLPEQARHARRNFFRKGNLIALRELALRRTADHVDDDVRAYRHERAIEPVWRTRETVLACLVPDPQAGQVVRSAHRLARQLECDLHVITVATPRIAALPQARRHLLEQAMALAEQLGARTETLAGPDPVQAAARYIRRHNISKAVVGRGDARGRPAAWLDALLGAAWPRRHGSLAESLARACPDVDVVRVATPQAQHEAAAPGAATGDEIGDTPPRPLGGYLWAAVYCVAATLVSSAAFPLLHQTNIVMFYLLAVVFAALRHGRGPAALAAAVSVGLFDFFFVQPFWSFAVSDVQYLLTFAVLLGVGLLVGQLTAGLRAQAQTAAKREADTRGLYEFARELSSALQAEQIVGAADSFLKAAFDARSALYVQGLDDRLHRAPTTADMTEPDAALAQWAFDHGQAAGTGTATLSNSPMLYLPLRAPMRVRGVLALEAPRRALYAEPETRRQLDAYATLIAIALERLHYVEVAQQALVGIESERLRNALLAAVSHDLRTPLTGLIGMSDTLARNAAALPDSTRELAEAIRDQARRMHALVVNLLDMARLQSHEAPLRREWQSIEELVGAALAAMKESLDGRPVTVARLSDLPLVECDGVLIERVLCNLLENAAKYTPPGSPLRIGAALQGGEMQVAVSDRGPGVPPGEHQRIFEKFTRGAHESALPGVGLGLAVCRAILEAHRGRIWVDPDYAEGARFVFALPLGVPPTLDAEPQ